MPWLPVPLAGRAAPAPAADPDAVRAAREEAGWTREQLADALGVLPAEVAAWEAGTVRVFPYQLELARWHIRQAAYKAGQAERDAACPWLVERRERFAALTDAGPDPAGWVERAIAAHRRDCPACRQALARAGDPAPPLSPWPPGVRSRLLQARTRLPPALQLPVHSLGKGLLFGTLMAAAGSVSLVGGDWWASPEGFLCGTLGVAWFVFTREALRPLADRDPRKAGQIQAAALTVPGLIAWGTIGSADLASPWLWGVAAIFSCLLGLVLGGMFNFDVSDDDRDAAYGPAPAPDDAIQGTRAD
jgi:DNA-binding XRE family transcriptional regulator